MECVAYRSFRTAVQVGELVTVSGWLPGMAWRPAGAITVRGDVTFLACARARELADALVLVVARMDAVADELTPSDPTPSDPIEGRAG